MFGFGIETSSGGSDPDTADYEWHQLQREWAWGKKTETGNHIFAEINVHGNMIVTYLHLICYLFF